MLETDLYIPIRDWLAAAGYQIHVELFDADIVAVKDAKITVVEMKLRFSNKLIEQLHARTLWADFVIAATPSRRGVMLPKNFRCSKPVGGIFSSTSIPT